MTRLLLFIAVLMLAIPAHADKKITDLPAQTASAVGSNDVFPMVDTVAGTTRKMKISQLFLVPSLLTPTFTSVTATTFTGNLTGNVAGVLTGTASFNGNSNPDTTNSRQLGSSTSTQFLFVRSLRFESFFTGGYDMIWGLVTGIVAGHTGMGYMDAGSTTDPMWFLTFPDAGANANPTKPITIETGDKTAGTGGGGNINLKTGSSVGGSSGVVVIQTPATNKPTCASGIRGAIYYTAGGAGVLDKFELCRKDAGDAYAWVTLL